MLLLAPVLRLLLEPPRDFVPLLLLRLRPVLPDFRVPPLLLFDFVDDELDFFFVPEPFDFDALLPFAPPVSLLTVAQARRAASLPPTPFFS